jgi:hypothetical protein
VPLQLETKMKIHFMRNMLLQLVINSPYSSVVERQSCKLKVRSSILRGGIFFVLTIPASTRSLLKSNRSKENRLMVSSPGWPTCRQRVVKTTSHQQLSIHFFSWPLSLSALFLLFRFPWQQRRRLLPPAPRRFFSPQVSPQPLHLHYSSIR